MRKCFVLFAEGYQKNVTIVLNSFCHHYSHNFEHCRHKKLDPSLLSRDVTYERPILKVKQKIISKIFLKHYLYL